jgi:hypothetical protein
MKEFIQIIEAIINVIWASISPVIKAITNNLATISTVLTAIASICVAITAFFALHKWKYQTRAQIHMQLMDELTDIVHEYIQAMGAPIQILKFAKIGILAYSETPFLKGKDSKNAGIVSYIEKNGKADQAKLIEYLDKVRPMKSKMISLATKGQALGFKNYKQCYDACIMLGWSYGQIEAFAWLIGSTNLNWENQEVQQTLDKVMNIDAEAIMKNLEEQNTAFLEFVKQSYQNLFGKRLP